MPIGARVVKSSVPSIHVNPNFTFGGVGATAGVKSNRPFNRLYQGVKGLGSQATQTVKGEVPLTTMFRTGDARRQMEASGMGADYQWGEKSLSWKKIGATAAGGYVGVDSVHRMATGGGFTRNAEGQRDIVGIPII